MKLKDCPSFPGYSVDEKGNVFSHRTRKSLKGSWGGTKAFIDKSICKKLSKHLTKKGYLVVCAKKKGESSRNHGVHQMVSDAYLGPIPNGMEVRHLDGIKTNNIPNNLAYGTTQDNANDRMSHGNYKSGQEHCNSKLTQQQADEIRILRSKKLKVDLLANKYGVSKSTIEDIIYNRTYIK